MEKGQNRNFREAGVEWSDHLHGESAVPYKLTILSCTVNQRSKIIEFKLNRDTGLGSLSRSNLSREQASGCKYLEEKTMKDNFYIPYQHPHMTRIHFSSSFTMRWKALLFLYGSVPPLGSLTRLCPYQ